MKILMDFDGVFTDPSHEGADCIKIFSDLLATQGGLGESLTHGNVKKARALIHASPFSYGWRSEGRLSAFGPEDPLIEGIGVGDVFDHWAKAGDAEMIAARKKLGIQSFLELCNQAFQKMSAELLKNGGPKPDLGAIEAVKSWISSGHQVRVVSNSDVTKLKQFFDRCGIHESNGFGFRGGARKFELSANPKTLELGEMKIFVDRPKYREVLIEEKPDFVIGDGISLDLATPLALSNEGTLSAKIKLFVKRRPYTPAFSQKALALSPHLVLCDEWVHAHI